MRATMRLWYLSGHRSLRPDTLSGHPKPNFALRLSAVCDDLMNATESCKTCGMDVPASLSFISDVGTLCPSCFAIWEKEQRAGEAVTKAQDARHLRQASRLGQLHGVNWGIEFVLLASWTKIPGWISSLLIAAALTLGWAIRFRSRTAYKAALALDTIGAAMVFVAAAMLVPDIRLLVLGFPLVFAVGLAWLTWRSRDAFTRAQRL